MIYKQLDKLQPQFRSKIEKLLERCHEIFVTETWRSKERQKELYSKGLSKTLKSKHLEGLAVDIAFRGNELYPDDVKKWHRVQDVAKSLGIDWGFELWGWDKPHFQDNNIPMNEFDIAKKWAIERKLCKDSDWVNTLKKEEIILILYRLINNND